MATSIGNFVVSLMLSSTMVVRVERTPSSPEPVAQDLRQVLRIARADLQQQAVIAGDVMDLQDFGNGSQRLGDARFGGPIGGAQGDEGQQPLIERLRVQMRRIAANHAPAFELPQPFEHGRGGKAHDPRDFGLGDTGVVLEEVEYLEVDGVEHARPALMVKLRTVSHVQRQYIVQ